MYVILVQLQQKYNQHEECIDHEECEHRRISQFFQIVRNTYLKCINISMANNLYWDLFFENVAFKRLLIWPTKEC